jgi:hypothetical protein
MATALLLAGAAAHASPLGDPGGGSGEEESDSANLYLALGATTVVVGIIVYDIISDAAREDAGAADSSAAPVEDTGVDWESVPVAGGGSSEGDDGEPTSETLSLVVEALPGEGGGRTADGMASRLGANLADTPVEVDPSSVSIGRGYTRAEKARMVYDFFSADLFLSLQPLEDDMLEVFLLDDSGGELASDTLSASDAAAMADLVRRALSR